MTDLQTRDGFLKNLHYVYACALGDLGLAGAWLDAVKAIMARLQLTEQETEEALRVFDNLSFYSEPSPVSSALREFRAIQAAREYTFPTPPWKQRLD